MKTVRREVSTPLAILSAAALLAACPPRASAQASGVPEFEPGPGDAVLLGANALLGGLTAGVAARLRGGEFQGSFIAGLVGGALGFAGKRVAAEPWDGAGLLGRQIASAGASVVRNASFGREPAGRLAFPVGPVRIYWEREGEGRVHLRVDLPTVAAAIYGAAIDAELDAGSSLSSGAMVFVHRADAREDAVPGRTVGGTIFLRGDPSLGAAEREAVFAHERVHVVQYDQAQASWGEDLDRWLVRLLGGEPEGLGLDLGTIGLVGIGVKELAWSDPPWEDEADGLDGLDGRAVEGGIASPDPRPTWGEIALPDPRPTWRGRGSARGIGARPVSTAPESGGSGG